VLSTAAPTGVRGGEPPAPAGGARARAVAGSVSGEDSCPEPGQAVPDPPKSGRIFRSAKRGKAPARGFLWIGGAVLVLLLAGGWLLVRNRASLFRIRSR
jgi:hypothetical protein